MLPAVSVVFTTFIPAGEGGFSRLMGAKQTVVSWARHLHYTGELQLVLSDDTVALAEPEVDRITDFSPLPISIAHTKGQGLGAALNIGLKHAFEHSPVALMADDSYSLVEDLDLTPWVMVLMRNEDIGAVSMMPPRPGQDGGTVIYIYNIHTEGLAGVGFERKTFAWNGRPMLYHERFFKAYDWFLEGVTGYELEIDMAKRYVERPGPGVFYPFFDPWQHVWSGVRLGDKPPGWNG